MSEHLGLSADEVLTTTRSVRKRLDLTRPVPRDVLIECIDIAHQSPTGSNSMRWRWMIVEDQDTRRAIADVYRRNFEEAYAGAPEPERLTLEPEEDETGEGDTGVIAGDADQTGPEGEG